MSYIQKDLMGMSDAVQTPNEATDSSTTKILINLDDLEAYIVKQINDRVAIMNQTIDKYSIHQPKGWPKGTMARVRFHNRINKLKVQKDA